MDDVIERMAADELRDAFTYDPGSGELRWKNPPKQQRQKVGRIAGTNHNHGYRVAYLNGKREYVHRVAWTMMTGEAPPENIDHINGDKSDNRWENLRAAEVCSNQWNRRTCARNTSGVKGVCWNRNKGKWTARVTARGKTHHVGHFDSLAEATAAVIAERVFLHGEFSNLGGGHSDG